MSEWFYHYKIPLIFAGFGLILAILFLNDRLFENHTAGAIYGTRYVSGILSQRSRIL